MSCRSDPSEAVWLRSLANSERRRLQSEHAPGLHTETLCSMNISCNTVSAANTAAKNGDMAKAQKQLAKALRMARKHLGEEHHKTKLVATKCEVAPNITRAGPTHPFELHFEAFCVGEDIAASGRYHGASESCVMLCVEMYDNPCCGTM